MRKKIFAFAAMFIAVFSAVQLFGAKNVYAVSADNESTGYKIVIEDDAGLLTNDEILQLAEDMWPITQYGGAAFVTTDYNSTTAANYAKQRYMEYFGNGSGTLFLIDMDNRQLYIISSGAIYRTVTSSKADTITDNVYRMATRGEYYECAKSVFEQEIALLEGSRIAEPMKHICNAILALIAAMLIFFVIVNRSARAKAASSTDLIEGAKNVSVQATEPRAVFLTQTKRYSPVVRSSGGGSGGGGFSGGGGSGGGFSGGGGGHGF